MAIIDIPLAYRLSYISSLGLGEIIGFSCGYFGRDVTRRKKVETGERRNLRDGKNANFTLHLFKGCTFLRVYGRGAIHLVSTKFKWPPLAPLSVP